MDIDSTNEGLPFPERMRIYGKSYAYLAFVIAALGVCIGLGFAASEKFNEADKLRSKATSTQEAIDASNNPEAKHLNNIATIYASLAVVAFFAAGVASAASAETLKKADAKATEFDVNRDGEDVSPSFTDQDLRDLLDGDK